MIPNVVSIAGVDPSGGAGVLADVKSISANGGYALAAVTALTAQNTCGVRGVHVPEPGFLRDQLVALSDDVRIDAVKIGMLGTAAVMEVVMEWLVAVKPPVVVLDPVMIATSGDALLADDAVESMGQLARLAHVVTPNVPELAALRGGVSLADEAAVVRAAFELASQWGNTVLAKGGHVMGDDVPDVLVAADPGVLGGVRAVRCVTHRVNTVNTHGTGCSLSAALATTMAQTDSLVEALQWAKAWLQGSLVAADALSVGQGHGPVHHFSAMWSTHERPQKAELPPVQAVAVPGFV